MHRAVFGLVALAASQAAGATDVNLNALLITSCTLTLATPGVMTASPTGTVIGSEQSGGTPASMTIVSLGVLPTISFAAPSLSAQAGRLDREPHRRDQVHVHARGEPGVHELELLVRRDGPHRYLHRPRASDQR